MAHKQARRNVVELARMRQSAYRADRAERRRIIGVTALVALALLAAGVSISVATKSNPPPSPPDLRGSSTPAPLAAPITNARGNIPKRIGQLAGFGEAKSPTQNTFAINRITVDPPCWARGTRPGSGHTVLLQVTVTTGNDRDRAAELGRTLRPAFFSQISTDGGVEHGAWPGHCTDARHNLPETFGTNRDYSGTIELQVPHPTGTLILAASLDNAGGWEWDY